MFYPPDLPFINLLQIRFNAEVAYWTELIYLAIEYILILNIPAAVVALAAQLGHLFGFDRTNAEEWSKVQWNEIG